MSERCCERSRAVGEPISGTAVGLTSVWIVLEHSGAWSAKAVADSDLPAAVKARLMDWQSSIPGARVQLARRRGPSEAPRKLWLGVSDLGQPRLVERSLHAPEELLTVDLKQWVRALRAGDPVAGTREVTEPLLLVCTNGRRDVCCSTQGVPVLGALDALDGVEAWHTTHLGGHRFAATLLQLPTGLCYGRLGPDDAAGLARAAQEGTVYRLDRLRGRTTLHPAEQAAESVWRERTGRLEADALAYAEHSVNGDRVMVTLRDREGRVHEVQLESRSLGVSAPPSCGKPPAEVKGWFVVSPADSPA